MHELHPAARRLLGSGMALLMLSPAAAALSGAQRVPVADTDVLRVEIADPTRYWDDAGFAEMTPAVRISVASYSGARTQIYLHVPDGAVVSTATLSDGGITLRYPPGAESDRVSLVPLRDANGTVVYTVEDVRGTRWDRDGREYYHVYRPVSGAPGAPLRGYEWPKDSPAAAAIATERLVALVAGTPLPGRRYPPDDGTVRRFRMLNNCAACHVLDKPVARRGFTRLPPWSTDASGLYTPLSVLHDDAPLSADANFHDPNAVDPLVAAHCPGGVAHQHGPARARYYSCDDGAAPIGVRDVPRGVREADAYTAALCASRRYLHARLDPPGQLRFAEAVAACATL